MWNEGRTKGVEASNPLYHFSLVDLSLGAHLKPMKEDCGEW